MAVDAVLTLIAASTTRNAVGVPVQTETENQIFCRAESITRAEFFSAGRNGLDPQWKFTVFHGDYEGEATVVYEGKRYGVYRTYRVPGTDDMELYVERKAGAERAAQQESTG